MQARFFRSIFLMLLIILVVLPVISQETPPVSDFLLSPSPSATATFSEVTAETTASLSPSPSPTASLTPEITVEVSPEATVPAEESTETEATEPMIVIPTLTQTAEVTVEVSETVVAVETTPAVVSSITPTATVGGFSLAIIRGEVRYQNRSEHSGIVISVLTVDGILLSIAESNSQGVYSLAAPADAAYLLRFEAPLHRRLVFEVQADEELASLVLAGGDLNQDACVNQIDLQALMLNYQQFNSPSSDINADGKTDLSDLAILTGNFEADCALMAESAEIP